jgi:hypothetical protein
MVAKFWLLISHVCPTFWQHCGPHAEVSGSLQMHLHAAASNACPVPQEAAVNGQVQVQAAWSNTAKPEQCRHAPLSHLDCDPWHVH